MGGKRKELNIKKEKEEGKHQVANGERERERERGKMFLHCVGDLVVQLISKTFVFSIFLGLWYKYALDVLG